MTNSVISHELPQGYEQYKSLNTSFWEGLLTPQEHIYIYFFLLYEREIAWREVSTSLLVLTHVQIHINNIESQILIQSDINKRTSGKTLNNLPSVQT